MHHTYSAASFDVVRELCSLLSSLKGLVKALDCSSGSDANSKLDSCGLKHGGVFYVPAVPYFRQQCVDIKRIFRLFISLTNVGHSE